MLEDIQYFRRRAAEQRQAALQAADPGIAAVHEQLAQQFEAQIALLAGNNSGSGIGLGSGEN